MFYCSFLLIRKFDDNRRRYIPIVVGAVTMETKQTELYEKVYSSIF